MKNMLIAHNGSVQNIPGIPDDVKAIYKTVWEISQKKVLDLAADRGAFICQSQSLNVHLQAPTLGQLTSMHFYGWKKGLKTGMYYLRTRPAAAAIQFTVDQGLIKDAKKAQAAGVSPNMVERGIPTPASSSSSSPTRSSSNSGSASTKPEPMAFSLPLGKAAPTPSLVASKAPPSLTSVEDGLATLEITKRAAEADPEFAAALQRQKDRANEEAKLLCSLENKEACVMCSG